MTRAAVSEMMLDLQVKRAGWQGRMVLVCAVLGTATTAVFGQGPGARAVGVAAVPVVARDVPASIRLVGTVLPDKSATVAAEVDGMLAEFCTEEGRFLNLGDVICRIDATVAELRLAEAQAVLEQRRAQLAEWENGERPEELRRLEATVAEAEALLEKWKFERDRIAGLFERQQANPKEKHDTDMEYVAAERRLAQSRAALEQAVNGARREVIDGARYSVAAQAAVVQRLERDLAKTQIRAPFDGFVVAKHTEVGEWIDAGGNVCDMVAIETVKVRADVPESAIPFARVGAPAGVEIEALGRSVEAKITRVIPLASAAARAFPVEIDLPNADHTLLPGMFVWARVPSGPPGERLMVSKDCIVARGMAKQIFVIRPGPQGAEMAIPTDVTTGLELAGEIEIRATGLRAGDRVVSRANERLFGPTPVIVSPADESPAAPGDNR